MDLRRSPRKATASAKKTENDAGAEEPKGRRKSPGKKSTAVSKSGGKARDAGLLKSTPARKTAATKKPTNSPAKRTAAAKKSSPSRSKSPSPAKQAATTTTPKPRGRPNTDTTKKTPASAALPSKIVKAKGTRSSPRLIDKAPKTATALPAPAEQEKSTDSPPKQSPAKSTSKAKATAASKSRPKSPGPGPKTDTEPVGLPMSHMINFVPVGHLRKDAPIPGFPDLNRIFIERSFGKDDYGEALRKINEAAYQATKAGKRVDKTRVELVSEKHQAEANRRGSARAQQEKDLNSRKKGERRARKDGDDEDDDNDDFNNGGGKKGNGRPRKGGRAGDCRSPSPRHDRSAGPDSSDDGADNNGGRSKSRRAPSPGKGKGRATSPAKDGAASTSKDRTGSSGKTRVASNSKNATAAPTSREASPGTKRKFSQTMTPEASPKGGRPAKAKGSAEKAPLPRRGNVRSVTNPEFVPGTKVKNPFFETLPAPEIWHRNMPPYFTAGETPYMERAISRQMNAEMAQEKEQAIKSASLLSRATSTVKSTMQSILGTSATTQSHRYPPKWDLPQVSSTAVEKTMRELQRGRTFQTNGLKAPSRSGSQSPERPAKRARRTSEHYMMSGAL